MSATILQDSDGVWVISVTGMLRKAENDAIQQQALVMGGNPEDARVQIVAREFGGWEPGADWGDVTFFIEHGYKIGRIAIVCDAQWETKFMAFIGAGMRKAPVKCFRLNQLGEAHAWVSAT